MKKLFMVGLMALASLSTGVANAVTYNLTGLQAGPLVNPGDFTATFNSPVADSAATLDFILTGFNTLDGNNDYKDLFTLTINGIAYSGSFNLGGGGSSDLTFGGVSAITKDQNGNDPGTGIGGQGGTTTVTGLPFNLLLGSNTFNFAYTAPGILNNSGQGLGDEGWGIASASITTAVPEPETYGMMLMGLSMIGFIARRRRNNQA